MIITTVPTDPSNTSDPIAVPPHPDGKKWRYFMLSGSGAHFADSATELIDVLVPGYADLDDRDASQALYDHAVKIANVMQASQLDDFDPQGEPEDVITALMQPRDEPFVGLDDGTHVWTHEVALVVIDRHYQPYTDLPMPTGNAVMVEPSDEVSYLASLDNIGYVKFMPNTSVE